MDPDEYKKEEDRRPFCKVCREKGVRLMPAPVCICTGSVAHICFECLRGTILHRDRNAPRDEKGEPLCPDCHTPYLNLNYRWWGEPLSYHEWMLNDTNSEFYYVNPIARALFYPTLIAALVSAFFLTPIPEGAWWIILRISLYALYLFGIIFSGLQLLELYLDVHESYVRYRYRERLPRTIVDVNPPRGIRAGARPKITPERLEDIIIDIEKLDDVIIDIENILPIDDIVADVFKAIAPIIGPKDFKMPYMVDSDSEDDELPAPLPPVRLPHPPRPQIMPMPQLAEEPPFPRVRPPFVRPPQLGPTGLSRRGKRLSRPQKMHPQASAGQSQMHTYRRSLQQQPRSRHQGRRQ